MSAPLFSVLIATYNYGHLIGRAIESVLQQTCQDFELIVIDDGSTDDTAARVAQYGEKVRYRYKENGGQSTACNLGADLATGRFILVLDADDCLTPDALASFKYAVQAQGADAEAAVYYGGYVSVSETGQEKVRPAKAAPTDPGARLRSYLERRLTGLQHGSTIVPRTAFGRFRYPEGLRNQIDNVFFGRLLAWYRAIHVDAIICRVHAHPQRERRQIDRILAAGTAPVDALFDPQMIPPQLQHLRTYYLARRLRSMARLLYVAQRYDEARRYYCDAFRASPVLLLELGTLKRALVCSIRGRRRPH